MKCLLHFYSQSYLISKKKNHGLRIILNNNLHFTNVRKSIIGKKPIKLLDEAEFHTEVIPNELCKSFTKGKNTYFLNKFVSFKGPKGSIKTFYPEFVLINKHENYISVSILNEKNKIEKSMWGTARSSLFNNLIGVTEGHFSVVKLVGIGFKAFFEKNDEGIERLVLKIGFPYLINLDIPKNLKVSIPNPTKILIEGVDKQQVKLFAATIREKKKPDPYKGKGIFVDDETITLKKKK